MRILIATALLAASTAQAGVYVDLGLGVPISPQSGYIPDQYGIMGVGYISKVNELISIDAGLHHRSETGENTCTPNPSDCHGDFAIEAVLRYEWK